MLMRYAMLLTAAATAVLGAMNLGASNANVMLVDAGHVLPQANAHLWVLGLVAGLVTLSLCRFVFSLPSMMDGWYRENKSWLVAAGGGGLIYGVFYLM